MDTVSLLRDMSGLLVMTLRPAVKLKLESEADVRRTMSTGIRPRWPSSSSL